MGEIEVSVIVPVYNRPQELQALLGSFIGQQELSRTEMIVIDDGSTPSAEPLTQPYAGRLPLKYIWQQNQGPGLARNAAAAVAKGKWLLFLDSDCELPKDYLQHLFSCISLENAPVLSGGPDIDRNDFTAIQKAINYSMTSPLTTGGIRGATKSLDQYYPRSFNMLVNKSVFDEAGGFAPLRFGEDLDLSMRILKKGHHSSFEPSLAIYHRRRTSFSSFFKQVFNSGMARIVLNIRHRGTLKPVHLLPSLFTLLLLLFPLLVYWMPGLLYLGIAGALALILHAYVRTNKLSVSLLSLVASIVQLTGYGLGLLYGWYKFILTRQPVEFAFRETFYRS